MEIFICQSQKQTFGFKLGEKWRKKEKNKQL